MNPRVTLGVATYERDTYLEEAVASCLQQTYRDLEVLVVLDGGRNPAVAEVLARFDDPRLRIVRHEANRGIAEAYNTIVREAPRRADRHAGRRRRLRSPTASPARSPSSTAIPTPASSTATRHDHRRRGASQRGTWPSRDRSPHELLRHPGARAQHARRPLAMVHRRVYEAVGGYDAAFRLAPGLRLLAARRARLPLPPRARRPADRLPPPRRELLRRVRAGARGARGRARPAHAHRRRAAARAGARARLGRHAPAGGRAPRARGAGRRLRAPRPAAARAGARAARPRRARARRRRARRPTGARSSSPPSASTTPAAAPPCRAWRPRSWRAAAGT